MTDIIQTSIDPIIKASTDAPITAINEQAQQYHAPSQCLKGKVILVTGAGDGIGRVASLTFAGYGATVILLGRTQSKLEYVYDEIEAKGFPMPAIIPLNLQTANEVNFEQIYDVIEKEFGVLHGILHNAGMLGTITPMSMYEDATWHTVMNVNLNAPLALTRKLLPLLKASGNASVVFTTSSVARNPKAFWGAYAISKQGLEGVCKIFSQEISNVEPIRFNCLNPNATRTNMRAQAYPGEDPMTLKTPEEIMPAYVYLFSDDSLDIKGKSLDAQSPQ